MYLVLQYMYTYMYVHVHVLVYCVLVHVGLLLPGPTGKIIFY